MTRPPVPPFTEQTARALRINDVPISEAGHRIRGPRPPAGHGQPLPLQ